MVAAIEMIRSERERQQATEGWSEQHDNQHTHDELARAAASYAVPERLREFRDNSRSVPVSWPWSGAWWKPSPDDRIRELVKAGALIVAEIQRLQRAGAGGEDAHGE